MKKLLILQFAAVLSILLSACGGKSGEPEPGPTPSTDEYITLKGNSVGGQLSCDANENDVKLEFNAKEAWTLEFIGASGPESWCTPSITSGDAGDITVNFHVTANESYDDRNVTIRLTCRSSLVNVTLTQKQINAMLVTSDKVEIDTRGGAFEVVVRTNIDYTVTIPPQYDWIHSSRTRGIVDHTESFKVDANSELGPRQGFVRFEGAGMSEEVQVFQMGANTIILDKTEEYVGSNAGQVTVEVKANYDFTYKVTQGADWIKAVTTRALSSHTLYFDYTENVSETSDRTGIITFYDSKGGTAGEFKLIQRFKGAVVLSEREIKASPLGGKYAIKYSSNRPMTLDIPASAGWVRLTNSISTRSMEDRELWIEVKQNDSEANRETSLKVKDPTSGQLFDAVKVTQEAGVFSYTTTLQEGDFDDARSHEFTVNVNTNLNVYFDVPQRIVKVENGSTTQNQRFRIHGSYEKGASGTLYVNIMGGTKCLATIPITYSGARAPVLRQEEYKVGADGGDLKVTVQCNTDIDVSESPVPWLKLKSKEPGKRGFSLDTYIFTVQPNTDKEERTATVSLSASTLWESSVTITQSGVSAKPGDYETVNVSTPGSLTDPTVLNSLMDKQAIALTGQIDASDVPGLRKLAQEGKLEFLDMSKVEIKSNGTGYQHPMYGYKVILKKDNEIGEGMFYNTNLRRVILPDKTVSIEELAFAQTKLEEIQIPNGVKKIGTDCFRNTNLSEVEIPGSVEELQYGAFRECGQLTTVKLHEGLKKIGQVAFSYSEGWNTKNQLSSINIPSTVEEIGTMAFNCSLIKEIDIPASVKKIGGSIFSDCGSLTAVRFKGSMETLPSGLVNNCDALTEFQFPQGLTKIDRHAMVNNGIKRLVIPEGVTVIEEGGLSGSKCTELILPSTLQTLCNQAIGNMTYVTSITLPAGLTTIKGYLLYRANSLKELHCRMATPPTLGFAVFYQDFARFDEVTLFVPRGSADKYRAAKFWSDFKNIVEE